MSGERAICIFLVYLASPAATVTVTGRSRLGLSVLEAAV